MSGAAQKPSYDIKSAFQAFYLAIFVYTVFTLVKGLGDGANPSKEILTSLADKKIGSIAIDVTGALAANTAFFWAFFVTFAVHLFRIYVTLEMMEEEFGKFEGFYISYSKFWRVLDFFSRLSIVAILTLKVIPITGLFKDFLTFVFYFYVALTVWGFIAMVGGKKSFWDAFMLSSLSGLITSGVLKFGTINWLWVIVICSGVTFALIIDLLALPLRNSVWNFLPPFFRKWLTNY